MVMIGIPVIVIENVWVPCNGLGWVESVAVIVKVKFPLAVNWVEDRMPD